MNQLRRLSQLWDSQLLSARRRQLLALRVNRLLLKEPVGARVRLGNALITHIPRSLSVTLSDPTEDGDIYYHVVSPFEYGRENSQSALIIGYEDYSPNDKWRYRGYVEWDISSIPDGATITDTIFKYHGESNDIDCHIHEMLGARPSTSTDSAVYAEGGEGTVYADPAGFPEVGVNKQVDLGSSADSDLQSQLVSDWFAIGVQSDDEGTVETSTIYSEDRTPAPTPKPTLYVEYTIRELVGKFIGPHA